MTLTASLLSDWFTQFNHSYFDSILPLPRLTVSHSKRQFGSFSFKRRRRLLSTVNCDFSIHVSDHFLLSEHHYQSVLLHEMIHYYIAYTKQRDTSPHGRLFRQWMDRLNSQYGWEIRVSESSKGIATRQTSSAHRIKTVVAVTLTSGRKLLSVVSTRYVQYVDRQLKASKDVQTVEWFVTSDPWFDNFPVVRTPRARRVSDEVFEQKKKEMEIEQQQLQDDGKK